MVTLIVLLQLAIVLTMIFIGARIGGIGMGIYGMVGVFILVFIFGMRPGNIPIDTTGTTRIGKYVLNHSFQLSGFITTFVSIGVGYLIISFLY